MIQIPLTADLHLSKGEAPILEFQDRKELENFIAYLQRQVEIIRGKRKQRLEYFSDGVYFDGEYLDLRPMFIAILRAFEFVDKLPKIELIIKVWGNSYVKDFTVRNTISELNREIKNKDIYIYSDNGYYVIHRPS